MIEPYKEYGLEFSIETVKQIVPFLGLTKNTKYTIGKCMSDVNKIEKGEKLSLEWKSFLFITVILFPILSVAFVGGYGFIVWALQVFFFGPPGVHGM
ncbi:Protein NapE [Vibrio scophthalmi]|uniref:Protein NapE n=2 Tax=Vibrio scophthalmi TaxID=45658 RepID=A0A1C7F8D2_9VIBR|nr:Protein NapE [Vibrio scophthalmi]